MTPLTVRELHCLIGLNYDDPERQTQWVRELALIRIGDIRNELPNPTGVCAAGLPIYIDQKGVYSSGYVLHRDGHSVCDHAGEVWDRDTTEIAVLKDEWANLKKLLDSTSKTN